MKQQDKVEEATATTPSYEEVQAVKGGETSKMGGDFAGIQVNLDHMGGIVPIPEIWVPPSMVEWGQVPDYSEIIVSEDLEQEEDDSAAAAAAWKRSILTVLPEVGCGVDNLEVLKSQQTLAPLASYSFAGSEEDEECLLEFFAESVSSTTDETNGKTTNQWRLETVFNVLGDAPHRVRLGVLVDCSFGGGGESKNWGLSNSKQFASPAARVSWERQFDATSSSGKLADGGGLDGRSVNRWMGPEIAKAASSFAKSAAAKSGQDDSPSSDSTTLNLPGNLVLKTENDDNGGLSLRVEHTSNNGKSWRTKWDFASHCANPAEAAITVG